MMNNSLALNLGRIIFGIPFLVFGLNHLMMAEQMAGIVPGFLPNGIVWVYFTGVALICAGLAIVAKRFMKWACYGLMLFLAVIIGTIHIPAIMAGANMPMPLISLLKDFGLFGGALILSTLDK